MHISQKDRLQFLHDMEKRLTHHSKLSELRGIQEEEMRHLKSKQKIEIDRHRRLNDSMDKL